MTKIRLYSRIHEKDYFYDDYLYNYVLFIYLEDKVYYSIFVYKPVSLKKKISKKRFEYMKEFLRLSLTTMKEDDMIEKMTGEHSKWIKIIDIKY